jgi:hypothetical protein
MYCCKKKVLKFIIYLKYKKVMMELVDMNSLGLFDF